MCVSGRGGSKQTWGLGEYLRTAGCRLFISFTRLPEKLAPLPAHQLIHTGNSRPSNCISASPLFSIPNPQVTSPVISVISPTPYPTYRQTIY